MTRRIVYTAALVAFVAATAMTITSVVLPNWVSYHVRHMPGNGGKEIILDDRFGLHQRCTNTLGCFTFPEEHRCEGSERSLCTMWRTTGFLMSLAVVVDLASLVGFWVIMAGGKVKRERGWKILGVMMIGAGVIQFFAMAVVSYLLDNDDLFNVPGYHLDSSWYLCTFSAVIAFLCAFGLAVSAYVLPREDGYEFLEDFHPYTDNVEDGQRRQSGDSLEPV